MRWRAGYIKKGIETDLSIEGYEGAPAGMSSVYLTERGNFWVAVDERTDSDTHGQIIGMVGAQCPPDPTPHTDGYIVPANEDGAPHAALAA